MVNLYRVNQKFFVIIFMLQKKLSGRGNAYFGTRENIFFMGLRTEIASVFMVQMSQYVPIYLDYIKLPIFMQAHGHVKKCEYGNRFILSLFVKNFKN